MSKRSKESQEAERSGLNHLRKFYEATAYIEDLTDTPGYDFKIIYPNQTYGVGDITWIVKQDRKQLSVEIDRQTGGRQLPLPPNFGFWNIALEDDAHMKQVLRKLPTLLLKMMALEQTIYSSIENRAHNEITQECQTLRINQIRRYDSIPEDLAWIHLKGGSAIIQQNYDALAGVIFKILSKSKPDIWMKLLKDVDAAERHIYLRLGTLVPFGVSDSLIIGNSPDEICDIQFPEGITHIWLEGSSPDMRNILWRRDGVNVYF